MAIKTTTSRNQSYWISNSAFSAIRASKTISFWFKCPTVEAAWGWTIAHWAQAGLPYEGGVSKQAQLFFRIIPGTDTSKMKLVRFVVASNGGSSTPNATTNDIDPDVWHHLVMVCTGTASLVYLDGALWTNAVQFPDVETGVLFIGGGCLRVPSVTDSSCISSGINSYITDLISFDGQLTAGEVTTLYAGGNPTYSRSAASVAGIDNTITMRCPLICDLKNTEGNNVIATNFNEVFADDSDLFDDWNDTNILTPQNRGVASKYLVGQSPGSLLLMSDSFGSITQTRLPLPLYNKLSMGEFGSIATTTPVGGTGLLTPSTAGNTATINIVDSVNNHQCEQQISRTITANSWANNVLTLTYNGPNLVVGQTIRISSSFYEVATFTPGSGTGTSQTGAVITINTTNPGSLIGQSIQSLCIIPIASIREVYSNGTTPIFCMWTADDVFNQASVPKLFSTGTIDRLTGEGDRTATFTLYYRIASDPAIQVKGFKVQKGLPNGTFETIATVTGLDNSLLSGTIQKVVITDVRQRNYSGTIGETDYRVRIVPTDTAADHQNRYLAFVSAEVTINNGALRMCDFTEGSWTYAGLRGVPSNKGMSAFDVKNLVRAYASSTKQNVIAFNYDLDNYTETDILTYFNQIKTLWDSCFDSLGYKRPKYLCWGMYMHAASGVSPTISLADWRARCMAYNLAQMKFAKQHPNDVEYISLYLASLGAWEMPCLAGEIGVAQPGATFSNAGSYRIDPRHIPQRVFTQSATWDQATLTLTSTNLFQYLYVPNGSYARIYVARTDLAKTAVVDGWYTIVSATNSTVTLASSITGGAAGIGADVTVYAVATQINSLHPSGYLPSVYAEMLTNEIIKSVIVEGGIQKQYWNIAHLPIGVGS